MFLAFLTLVVESTLILPLVVAVVTGDSIAGEANRGTLRYLLTVPAGRTRLLGIKFTANVAFCAAACLLVSAVAVAVGAILFPVGPVTLLSGNAVPLGEGLLRLLFVTLYLAAAMAALGAIGLAISTFTEHPIGAIAAVLVIARGQRGRRQRVTARRDPPVPADALVAVVRLAAARADRVAGTRPRPALVRRLHRHLLLDRVGPLHHRRRDQLARQPGPP